MTGELPARLPRWALAGIFGGLFTGYLGLSAVIPVLPGYVRGQFGAGNLVVGLVVTGTGLTALVVRPLAGSAADRYGYRLVMRAGSIIVAAGGGLYFAARGSAAVGVTSLVGVRLLLGVGEAALFTAGAAWTVSLSPDSRRGQLIGLYGVSMWGGISAGTLIGAIVQQTAGYSAVWAFTAIVPAIGMVLISLVPAPPPARTAPARHSLAFRPALVPGIGLALGAAGYAGLASFIVLALRARGIANGVAVLTVFSAVYAGTRLVIGHLPDRFGPRRVAAVSGIGEAAGLLIVAAAPDLALAIGGAIVMGVGFSLLHPSFALMVMERTDRSQQGAALGAYTSFWDLGLAVWGPVTGAIASGLGYPSVFVAGAICALAATVVALSQRQVPRPAPAPAVVSRPG